MMRRANSSEIPHEAAICQRLVRESRRQIAYPSATIIVRASTMMAGITSSTSGDSNSVLDAATSHALGRGVPRLHDAVQVLADDRVVRGGDDRSESVRVSVRRHERKDLTLHVAEGRSEDRLVRSRWLSLRRLARQQCTAAVAGSDTA